MTTLEPTAVKLEIPFTCIVAGATGSVKTTLLLKILQHGKQMFTSELRQFIFCYGICQTLYDDMKNSLPNVVFYECLPSKDVLETWAVDPGHKILVLDDLLQRAAKNPDMVDLFCQYSHHLNFSTKSIRKWHSLFEFKYALFYFAEKFEGPASSANPR